MTVDSTAPEGVEAADPIETEVETEVEEVEAVSDEEAEQGEIVEEEIEFDFGGNKVAFKKDQIPGEVAEKVQEFAKNIWGDYTRKSQEIAETRKAIEAKEKAVEKLVSLNGDALHTYSKGLSVKAELEQLTRIDLNVLWASNPDEARRVSDAISRKQAEFQSIVSQVAQKEQELTYAQQAELARRIDEGKHLIERRVKGFTQRAPEVVDYVTKTYGYTKQEAESWPLDPRTAEMAYKAMLYDRMQTAKQPAPKTPIAEPVAPMRTKGSATSTKDPDKMPMDQWLKWRQTQLAKRG